MASALLASASSTLAAARRRWLQARRPSRSIGVSPNGGARPSSPTRTKPQPPRRGFGRPSPPRGSDCRDQEAVDIYRDLMERSSDAVLPALVTTLSTHSEVLAGAQGHAEAVVVVHTITYWPGGELEHPIGEGASSGSTVPSARRQVSRQTLRCSTDCADGWRRRQHRRTV